MFLVWIVNDVLGVSVMSSVWVVNNVSSVDSQ